MCEYAQPQYTVSWSALQREGLGIASAYVAYMSFSEFSEFRKSIFWEERLRESKAGQSQWVSAEHITCLHQAVSTPKTQM